MSNPQAGWYPDPSGDASKLRYWDGTQWTNDFMDVGPATQAAPEPEPQRPGEPQPQQRAEYVQATVIDGQTRPAGGEALYEMSSQDQTLRLIAFILNIISAVAAAVLIIPLAWMIPMTVHSYGIYKGKKPNTVAFGVCTLIFLDFISGILLLVSKKDK